MAKPPTTLEQLTPEQLNDMKAAMKAYNATMKRDGYGRAHAKAGGEMGINGEWYEGGKFLPENEVTMPSFNLSSPKYAMVAPATRGKSARGYSPIWDMIRQFARCPYEVDEATGQVKVDRSLGAMTYSESTMLYEVNNNVACNTGVSPKILLGDDEAAREQYFVDLGERAFPKHVYTEEEKANIINHLRTEYDKELAKARADIDVRTHLLALWKQGNDYVSDLYMVALQKAALEKNGIPPTKKALYYFQFINRFGQAKKTETERMDADKFDPVRLQESFAASHDGCANVRIACAGEVYPVKWRDVPAPIYNALPQITLLGDDTDYEAIKSKEIEKRKAQDGGAMEKGKFSNLQVVCTAARRDNGYYGDVWKYKFKTADGKLLHWTSSNNQGIGIGDSMELSGTCKGSSEFQGSTYNFVSRCTASNYKKAEAQELVKRTEETTVDLA